MLPNDLDDTQCPDSLDGEQSNGQRLPSRSVTSTAVSLNTRKHDSGTGAAQDIQICSLFTSQEEIQINSLLPH